MGKRFTDTEKWEDSWFRNLLCDYQKFWIFILDKCDMAGVWEVDFEVAEFFLKQKVNQEEYLKVFESRVIVFDEGKRWFIPKFIKFQYGTLDPNCRPHKSVLNLLSSYKIEGYLKGIYTLKDKNKDKIKDKDNTKTIQHTRPASIQEVKDFLKNENMSIQFFDYYEANGWRVGKNPMKNWQAAARNWQRRQSEFKPNGNGNHIEKQKGPEMWKCFVCPATVPESKRREHMDAHKAEVAAR